jgi:hypothetical protein
MGNVMEEIKRYIGALMTDTQETQILTSKPVFSKCKPQWNSWFCVWTQSSHKLRNIFTHVLASNSPVPLWNPSLPCALFSESSHHQITFYGGQKYLLPDVAWRSGRDELLLLHVLSIFFSPIVYRFSFCLVKSIEFYVLFT